MSVCSGAQNIWRLRTHLFLETAGFQCLLLLLVSPDESVVFKKNGFRVTKRIQEVVNHKKLSLTPMPRPPTMAPPTCDCPALINITCVCV